MIKNRSIAEREAFEIGSADKLKGYSRNHNPYVRNTRKWLEWDRGFYHTTKLTPTSYNKKN